ncbi:golgin subfamily A member 4 isoform X4 [Anguilla anguilla]|uniref:golgin subfamily A member 4 isoform X4 n=1 Tax=Anguilla anguilla TaxID=7936 RepID=UPI0015A95F16|nr:golgin subfamily A member 4 isoform X4 [Anguilla anguilla]
MGTQGTGRKRIPNRERLTAEDDALNQIAREAEARLAAKRAARAEAREIRMKELERQQKEIYQVQKKYYGLDNKWGDIEQWMEDSERYSRHSRRNTSVSDDEERMSVGSRGSLRSDLDPAGAYGGASVGGSTHSLKKSKKKKKKHSRASNGYEDDYSIISSRSSRLSDESKASRPPRLDLQLGNYSSSDLYSTNSLPSSRLPSSTQNGSRPSLLCSDAPHSRSLRGSVYEDSLYSSARRFSGSSSRAPSEYSGFLGSNSRASSRASSARASPVEDSGSVASILRSAASGSSVIRSLDDISIPELPDVEERSDRDFLEKGSRTASTLSAATLASLGGTSSRRGSGDTALSVDTEASIREIKDSLVEVEEKYRKAMVSNAQLDNEKSNLMYQVDTLKDSLMELEEQLCEARREFEAKAKDFEREKYAHSVLQFQFNEMKETLKQSEELLTEIRQLRMKQDGFVREISDLQETVEWKDKKIGALERQKEYSDAIRNERDELRDEVVQLKDVLKKHGIVLGADLTTNGEAGEGVLDGLANADSATRLAQDSQTPHAGGDGMLGKVKEAQLGGRDVEEVDSGAVLDKASVHLKKRQQGQTESLEEHDKTMIPGHPSEDHVSSQNSSRYCEITERQYPEKVRSDSTTSTDEVAPVDTGHSNGVESYACPHSITESDNRPVCHPEVQVVITGPEEEMTGEGESVGNSADKGENKVIHERSEDVGERCNSAGLGEVESAAENNLEARSVSEKSKDEVAYENLNAVQDAAQGDFKEGFENTESCVDGSIQIEDMLENAAESSALECHKNDSKDTAEWLETNHLNPEQGSEIEDRDGAEKVLKSAKMGEFGDMKSGEDDEKCSSLAAKDPGSTEVPNMEQGPGTFAMDSKQLNGADQDKAQSGDSLTTGLPHPPTAQQSQQKAEEPPAQTATKTPQQDRSGASGKKKKKRKKKGKKGGVHESSSKECEKPDDDDGDMPESSVSTVEELVEQAEISSREHLTSEKGEKSETSTLPEGLEDDTMTNRENKPSLFEGERANDEAVEILAKTEKVKPLEGCPMSAAGADNADGFEKVEDTQLSGPASQVETQTRNDTEEVKEEQSPETQEAESVKTGDPVAANEPNPKLENTDDLKGESALDQEVENAGKSESDLTTYIADCVNLGSAQEQSLEEMETGTDRNKVQPQGSQGTQEYVPSSLSIETEDLAAAPPETGTTEDIDSCEEAESLLQDEPADPLNILEEKQPSVDNSVELEREEPENIAIPEEDPSVKAPSQESVANQGTQECVLLSPSSETEELAAAPSETGATEDLDSCKEAESLMQDELTDSPDFPGEKQPSIDNSVEQETEESENMAIPEEDASVNVPPEGSMGHGEESTEGGQGITEDGNCPGKEHCDDAEGLGTSSTETNSQDSGRESGESADQQQVDSMVDEGLSKEEEDTLVVEEKLDEVEPLPQEEVDNHKEEDENEEGESFEFEDDLEVSANLVSGGGTHEDEGAGSTPTEGGGEQEDGSKAEPQAGTDQNETQDNVEAHLTKSEEPRYEKDKESTTREEPDTAQVDKVQNETQPGEDVFEEGTCTTAAERNVTQRTASQETEESVSQTNEQNGRRDSSKSNKKGKGKGKEDCRMS